MHLIIMITAVKWNEFEINFTHDTIFLVWNLQVSIFCFLCHGMQLQNQQKCS